MAADFLTQRPRDFPISQRKKSKKKQSFTMVNFRLWLTWRFQIVQPCSTQVFTKSLSHHHSENIETYDTGRFFCNFAVDVHSISLIYLYQPSWFNCWICYLSFFISLHVILLPVSENGVPLLRPANQSAHNGHDAQQTPSSSNWHKRPMRREWNLVMLNDCDVMSW